MSATWEIREGDAPERLREMPDESVQCCVTSPPYFGLRDYGVAGQIGLETTPDEFVARLVGVFREVRRVLRSDGTLWLNIGDSYSAQPKGNPGNWGSIGRPNVTKVETGGAYRKDNLPGIKQKDLIGIPWLLAFALRADGWYLRSDIIWAKPNPMPESVTDRPTSAHEHVFLLAKSARYFYDADAIRESYAPGSVERIEAGFKDRYSEVASGGFRGSYGGPNGEQVNAAGRNKRNVWEIATQPYPDAHFATFPPKLVEPCILAGAPEKACGRCGAPWRRLTEIAYENPGNRTTNGPRSLAQRHETAGFAQRLEKRVETTGFEPTCEHSSADGLLNPYDEENVRPAVVLDPFCGAGTTGLVALRHGRSFIGIELSPAYAEMARERIRQDAPLLNTPAEVAA